MSAAGAQAFPEAACAWLTPDHADTNRFLAVGRSTNPLLPWLARTAADLVVADTTPAGVRSMLRQAVGAIPAVAEPTALPFAPCSFDAVYAHQNLHAYDVTATLREFARVLAPGGRLAVSWTVRDDSVPWVRRLTNLMRSVDSEAMQGDYGSDAAESLMTNPFFVNVEQRTARQWVPIARVDLLDMVAKRFPDLEPDRRTRLMTQLGELYESSARPPAPLLLPYQVVCWRADVDHAQFTSPIRIPDGGLPISL